MKAKDRTRDEWEIRDDVRTLKSANEIRKDPQRVRDAQNYIRKEREQENAILGMDVPPAQPSRSRNPATVQGVDLGKFRC